MSLGFGAAVYLTYTSPFFGAMPFADIHRHIIICIKSPFVVILVKTDNVNSLKVLSLGWAASAELLRGDVFNL